MVKVTLHGHTTLAVFGKIKGGYGFGVYGDLGAQCVIGTAIVIDGNKDGHITAVLGIKVAGVAIDGSHTVAKMPDVSVAVFATYFEKVTGGSSQPFNLSVLKSATAVGRMVILFTIVSLQPRSEVAINSMSKLPKAVGQKVVLINVSLWF